MRPTDQEFDEAVSYLAAMKYFPPEAAARVMIASVLRHMVETKQQLAWLVETMVNRVGEWPGPRELRAVFCTRYRPADGVEEWSQLAGFTALDSEAREYIDRPAAPALQTRKQPNRLLPAADHFVQIFDHLRTCEDSE